MKTILTISAVLLLVGCGAGQQREISERRSGFAQQEIELASPSYHSDKGWQKTIQLRVSVAANDEIVTATINAIDTWNEAAGREIIRFAGREQRSSVASLYDPLNDSSTVLYAIEDWTASTGKDNDVLGTTIWENNVVDDNVIEKGDIILNSEEYYYTDATIEPEDYNGNSFIVDAETVILHEMGHLLGLNHVNFEQDPDSVMHTHASIGLGQYHRVLSDKDASLIQDLYN